MMTDEAMRRFYYDQAEKEMEKGRVMRDMEDEIRSGNYQSAAEMLERNIDDFHREDLEDIKDSLRHSHAFGKKHVLDVVDNEIRERNRD